MATLFAAIVIILSVTNVVIVNRNPSTNTHTSCFQSTLWMDTSLSQFSPVDGPYPFRVCPSTLVRHTARSSLLSVHDNG